MKITTMRKSFILFLLLTLCIGGDCQTIIPAVTEEICTHPDYSNASIGQSNVLLFTATFDEDVSKYSIVTNPEDTHKPVACKIVQNITGSGTGGTFYVAFEDQRATKAKFTIAKFISKDVYTYKTYEFAKLRSIKGLKPELIFPSPINAPLCSTGNVIYSVQTLVRYREVGTTNEFGSMPNYEYSVPAGWKVGTTVSTGPSDYIMDVPGATITYDGFNNGEVKIRATQVGYVCGPSNYPNPGDWAVIPALNRPALKLTTNGNTSLQLSCGINSTHTFEVEGSSSAPCATYRWDLGSNSNHWIYGSGDAPQIINTTTGSLTLTAKTCEGLPSSITVTLIMNNKDVGTLTLPVTISYGNYSIAGADKICGFENYNIVNLPCSATVAWSINEPDRAILTSAGSTARLRGKASGKVILKAELNGVCGSGPIVLTKEIRVGDVMPMITDPYDVATNLPGVPVYNKPYYIEVLPITPGYTYTWSIASPDPSDPVFLASGPRAYITFTEFGCYTVTLKQEGGCLGDETFVKQVCPIEELNGHTATVSPNPAKELLTILLTDDIAVKGKKVINEKVTISIFSQQSGNKEKEWVFDHQRQYTLNIAGLKKGIHIVRIKKGRSVISKTIIVE